MGDLVQSLYLLEDLKRVEGHEVALLVDRRLEGFAWGRAPWLDAVYSLDVERYLRGFRNGLPWRDLWPRLAAELQPVRSASFERIVNLNYGRLAGRVVDAVRGPARVEGFHRDAEGSIGDPWVEMISRLVQANRRWNRFHLVDVFRFHAAKRLPSTAIQTRPSKPLDHRSLLALQVGTRAPKRTWTSEAFVDVVRGLEQRVGCEILLLGEARERPLAHSILREVRGDRVKDLVGKTSLEDLVQILGGCDRLVSGDTGTLHLACRLGVPSVAVFFGPAYAFETGPYGTGHVVVQAEPPCAPCNEDAPCADRFCADQIVSDTLLRLLEGESIDPPSHVSVYTSGFVGDWMLYRPASRKHANMDDAVGFLYWGGMCEYLKLPEGRLPSIGMALRFLIDHYRLEPSLVPFGSSLLQAALPSGIGNGDGERLHRLLCNGWHQMKEMIHESVGEEPCHPQAPAA
jgi:hypothetical protein